MKKTVLATIVVALVVTTSEGAGTSRFVLDTPAATADATASGIAVGRDGSLRPLAPLHRVATFDEPLGLALAVTEDGTAWVGTGHPARIYRVTNTTSELVAEVEADQITALLVDPQGTLWAATAIPAALLRLSHDGTVEVVSRLAEGNLWDLAWFSGTLVAAAGNPGRLLRAGETGLELISEIPDQHARCLSVADGVLFVGTSGKGLVLRWDGHGPLGALFDSEFTEIAALAAAPNGVVYASGLTGDPTLGKPTADASPSDSVSVSTSTSSASTPPQTGSGTATSEILKIYPEGAATVLHRFTSQIAGALVWRQDALVVGTGIEGELWRIVNDVPARLDTVDAAQIVRLAGGGAWVLTQGPVELLHRSGPPEGAFVSPVLDAKQPSRWGAVTVHGSGDCSLSFRSGVTEAPDTTWSSWTEASPCSARESTAPPARYLQWKLALSGESAFVDRVTVAYRQINLPPTIESITVHEPAVIFLKTPPPSDRVVEVSHPQLEGIFTTIGDDDSDLAADRPGKKYYRIGYQSVSWKATDPNGDPLRFKLEVGAVGSDTWYQVRDNLDALVLALDTQALAEGEYRFRLTASDVAANPASPATDTEVSSWFTVDTTAPDISVRRSGSTWVVSVTDNLTPITLVEWNRDGDEWHPISPVDGIMDSTSETFRLAVSGTARILTFRASDENYNRATVTTKETP